MQALRYCPILTPGILRPILKPGAPKPKTESLERKPTHLPRVAGLSASAHALRLNLCGV